MSYIIIGGTIWSYGGEWLVALANVGAPVNQIQYLRVPMLMEMEGKGTKWMVLSRIYILIYVYSQVALIST